MKPDSPPFAFSPLEPSAATGFAGNALDRLAERRDDADLMAELRARQDARFVLFSGNSPLLRASGNALTALHDRATAQLHAPESRDPVLLGVDDGVPVFALAVDRPPDVDQGEPALELIDLRSLAVRSALSPHELGVLAQARSLLDWHNRHGFCAVCGAPTGLAQAGYRRDCSGCGATHFPRTDPVVIMLAIDGERCLLGRQARFAPNMYSCLAGFVEPGETLESAVRREVHEEASITIGRVVYHASQPWPFPSSLMIGCFAEALTRDIVRDENELEDARWFAREELAAMLEGRHSDGLCTPPAMAIAHHLMRAYVEKGSGVVETV